MCPEVQQIRAACSLGLQRYFWSRLAACETASAQCGFRAAVPRWRLAGCVRDLL